MSTIRFQSGPWKLHEAEYPDAGGYVPPRVFSHADDDNPKFICEMSVRDGETELANGSLVAAAPEMYEAMAEFVHRVEIGEVLSKKTYAKFKEILAKVDSK